MEIRLSVITPVYNGKQFIDRCINVVIDQACPTAEHIIVDGASTDGTVEIIKAYAEKFPHIRYISEPDRGQSDAMNKGISLARGPIIGFLNVDDYYEPGVLNRALELFEALPEPTFLTGDCNVWDQEGRCWFVNKPKRLKITDLLLGPETNPWPINPSQYFYHASLHKRIGAYKIDEHYALDLDFILKAVRAAHVKHVDEIWGNYRFLDGTKTYADWKRGENVARYQTHLKSCKKSLSILERSEYLLKWLHIRPKLLPRTILLSSLTPSVLRSILLKMVRH